MIAAETRAILDLNHDFMLKQMAGNHLDVKKLLAPTQPGSTPPPPDPGNEVVRKQASSGVQQTG